MPYLVMLGLVTSIVFVCALIAAILETSTFRAGVLGAGAYALLALGMLGVRVVTNNGPDEWSAALRMVEATVNTYVVDQHRAANELRKQWSTSKDELQKQLTEQRKETDAERKVSEALRAEIDKHKQELPGKLDEAEKRGAAARAAELEPVIRQKDEELKTGADNLAQAKTRVGELEALKQELESARELRIREIVDLRQKLKDALDRIEKLEAELTVARSKIPPEPAPPAPARRIP
ncbi:MAG TPA: hypothetical protein ENN09_00165 [Planctomycetes bacterium]|nr:hypothetical protein [Planctomycetota bacterium]